MVWAHPIWNVTGPLILRLWFCSPSNHTCICCISHFQRTNRWPTLNVHPFEFPVWGILRTSLIQYVCLIFWRLRTCWFHMLEFLIVKIEELLFDIFDYVSICFNYVLVSCKHFVLSPRCVETTLLEMACSVLRPARLYCEERGNQPSRSYEAGEVSETQWMDSSSRYV